MSYRVQAHFPSSSLDLHALFCILEMFNISFSPPSSNSSCSFHNSNFSASRPELLLAISYMKIKPVVLQCCNFSSSIHAHKYHQVLLITRPKFQCWFPCGMNETMYLLGLLLYTKKLNNCYFKKLGLTSFCNDKSSIRVYIQSCFIHIPISKPFSDRYLPIKALSVLQKVQRFQ